MLREKTIAIILLISMFFHFWFIIIHLNHECTHDDHCPICALINRFKRDLNGYKPCITFVIVSVLLFISRAFYKINKIDRKRYTPIGLKVELIN